MVSRSARKQNEDQKCTGIILVSFIVIVILFGLFFHSHPKFEYTDYLKELNAASFINVSSHDTVDAKETRKEKTKADQELLRQKVVQILGDEQNKYGIWVKDTDSGEVFGLNDKEIFPPASIYKVPLAILVLKDIDSGKRELKDTYPIKSKNKAYESDPMYRYPENKKVTIEEYLNKLIRESDNTAMLSIEDMLGGVEQVNERFKSELEISSFFRKPFECTPEEIGRVYEKIYKQKYLSPESNELLISHMKKLPTRMQDRIPAGLNSKNILGVAHKIGNVTTSGGVEYADAGIVYDVKGDYVIVIVNKDINEAKARNKIPQVSEAVYEWMISDR